MGGRQESIPMTEKIKLYSYWRSSCSWRVRIALSLKKIEYEYVPVNLLKSEQLEDNYKAEFNGMGQVPTLLITKEGDESLKLTQSCAIIEYVDQAYPSPVTLIPDVKWQKY